jgi:hypothetical protein
MSAQPQSKSRSSEPVMRCQQDKHSCSPRYFPSIVGISWASLIVFHFFPVAASAQDYLFAGHYSQQDLVSKPQVAEQFMMEYMKQEGEYFRIASEEGIALDGWELTSTLDIAKRREHTAASKECLHKAVLVKGLYGDPLAVQLIGKGSPSDTRRIALEILEDAIDSYEQYNRDYPGYGGFLTWIKIQDGQVMPTSDWTGLVPALDPGEWVWSLYAVYHALYYVKENALADRYHLYFDMLVKNAPAMFYDPATGKVRAEVRIKNVNAKQIVPSNYENNKPDYYLDDVYEGMMMNLFLVLFTDLPASDKSRLLADIHYYKFPENQADIAALEATAQSLEANGETRRPQLIRDAIAYATQHPDSMSYGTTYIGWPGVSPRAGSPHIKWAYMFLPFTDNPIARKIYEIQEEIRTLLNEVGLPVSTNTPGYVGYTQYDRNVFAPYGAFSMIHHFSIGGDVAVSNVGLAWLYNMLMVDKMQGKYGSGESFSIKDGTYELEEVSFLLTADGKMTLWLAMMGGLQNEIRQYLDADGLYTSFIDIVARKYAEAFGSVERLRDQVSFRLPVAAVTGTWQQKDDGPTLEWVDMNDLWKFPEVDRWGDLTRPERANGDIFIDYLGNGLAWGWAGGGFDVPIVPAPGSAIYFKGNGSFKLKLEGGNAAEDKFAVKIPASLKPQQGWTKISLSQVEGKKVSVMVIDEILEDITLSSMLYSPQGDQPSQAALE